jgi:hypothetical protein
MFKYSTDELQRIKLHNPETQLLAEKYDKGY